MKTVEEHIQSFEPAKRNELERIRSFVKELVPEAEECIYYSLPAFKWNGKGFLAYNAYKDHIGIFPCSGYVVEVLHDKLKGYRTFKGTIQIPYNHPISKKLLKTIIDCRIEQIKNNYLPIQS